MRKPREGSIKVDLRTSNLVKPEDKIIMQRESNDETYEERVYERPDGSRYCLEFIAYSPYFNSGNLDSWYYSELHNK